VFLRRWSFDSERDLNLFFRNKYSGQVTGKNKINILSCHETKRNTAYIDDFCCLTRGSFVIYAK
jgi:hypothetical protein